MFEVNNGGFERFVYYGRVKWRFVRYIGIVSNVLMILGIRMYLIDGNRNI